jgi:hypothetical protein
MHRLLRKRGTSGERRARIPPGEEETRTARGRAE